MGLATSFYNDRDSDLAEMLVKTLLETHQVIPDFLTQYVPEGFVPDADGNVTGNLADLQFENDSNDGGNENGSGWAEDPADTPAENPAEAPAKEAQAAPGWNAQIEATQAPQALQPAAPAWIPQAQATKVPQVPQALQPVAPAWDPQAEASQVPQAPQPTPQPQSLGSPADQFGGPQQFGAPPPTQTVTPQIPTQSKWGVPPGPPQGQYRMSLSLLFT